jgi:hypothetical protein
MCGGADQETVYLHCFLSMSSVGIILAYSNSLAGYLADVTAQQGLGNIGCFFGGATACVVSALALVAFSVFGDLGRDDLLPKKKKA